MKLAVMYKEDCITACIGAENEEYTVFFVWTEGDCNGLFLRRPGIRRDLWNHLISTLGGEEIKAPPQNS